MGKVQRTQGFTLVELLIVIGIIGLLAGVLIPSLIAGRIRANDVAASSVARELLNGIAAVEAGNANFLNVSSCSVNTGGGSPYVTYTLSDNSVDAVHVNFPVPLTSATCSSSATAYQVVVSYTGGTAGRSPLTLTATK